MEQKEEGKQRFKKGGGQTGPMGEYLERGDWNPLQTMRKVMFHSQDIQVLVFLTIP